MKKLYCYCIFKQEEADKKLDINNKVFIKYKDLVLLCDTVKSDVKATKDGILNHDKVIRKAFEQTEVIPMSYGILVPSKEEAKKFLVNNHILLENIFKKIQNKIEVSLKLIWKKDSFIKEVENKEIIKLKQQLTNQKRVLDQDEVELGKLVEERVNQLREKYEAEIIGKLKIYAEDFKVSEDMIPRMAFKASFLVDKSNEAKFDEIVNEFYQKYMDTFNFKYIGPLPPYSFIDEKFRVN